MKAAIKFTLLLAIFYLPLSADKSAKAEISKLEQTVLQIKQLSDQISIIKAQNDKNSNQSGLVNTKPLEANRQKLLTQIPVLIMQNAASDELIKGLNVDLAKAQNATNSNKSVSANIQLANAEFRLNFYEALNKLGKEFDKNSKTAEIKSYIEGVILKMQTSQYRQLEELKESIAAESKNEQDFNSMMANKQNYEEILGYLRDNADLLGSSFFLSNLNLKMAIDYINEKIPLSEYINYGKILIIIVIFAFFISLTKLLAKLTYHIFIAIFAKSMHAEALKDQVLEIIKNPISALLIAYAVGICLNVAYYPQLIPSPLASALGVAYIACFCWLALMLLNGYGMVLLSALVQKSGRKEVINLILKIVYFIVVVIAILMILSRLGFDISALIASLGIGGLAVAFAAKDIIANFFASVMLLFDNSFSQGDWIVCGDIEGAVVEIGLRKTTLRTFDNALVFVPNSVLTSNSIRNWTRRKVGRLINFTVGVTYDSTPEALRKCINDIKAMLEAHEMISKEDNGGKFEASSLRQRYKQNIVSINDLAGYKSELYVCLSDFGDSSIDIMVYCFAKPIHRHEYLPIKQDVLFKVMDIVTKNGLSFAFPSQSLYFANALEVQNQTQLKTIQSDKGENNA
ncbi:mechanosensitive ion channel family protein [Campylobacter sp. 19-13652]|uniref:mechanosensitive ion channel family protein n=1 Tax=Campylobacter sp. 19-13652 TaxID=2840180 RepID=UPI001C7613C8|nr:mechanosensitive ion channel family protein [Campylobacter sp. 19-13652]BCX80203.1 mechanosensitive ion channel protein [Campylobacter sp. 19-13652]